MKSSISVIRISHLEEGVQEKVLLRGVFINRDTNGEGVIKVGTTLIRVSTVMGILYNAYCFFGANNCCFICVVLF